MTYLFAYLLDVCEACSQAQPSVSVGFAEVV